MTGDGAIIHNCRRLLICWNENKLGQDARRCTSSLGACSVFKKGALRLHRPWNLLPQKEPITFIFLFVFCPQLLKGDFCSSGAEMLVVHKISHNFPSQQKKQFDTVSRIFLPIIAIQEETSESDDDSLVQITRKVNFVSNPWNVYNCT